MLKSRANCLLSIVILGALACCEMQRPLRANDEVNYLGQTDFPRVVELDPPNGATGVDPAREHIMVTFDRPMCRGHSWVLRDMPPRLKLNRIEWINDHQCRAYVDLEAGAKYGVWLNHGPKDSEFQSREGVSAQRVHWTFQTRAPRATDTELTAWGGKGASVELEPEAANVVKRFWIALEQSDWKTVLSLCSMEVREEAKKYPSPEAFFQAVVPVEEILKKTRPRIGYWLVEPKYFAYIYDVRISQEGLARDVSWGWMVRRMDAEKKWEVHFSTIPFKTWVANEKEEIERAAQEQERRLEELAPRLKGVRTFLTPEREAFKLGEPIHFRLQLINGGDSVLFYDSQQVAVNYSMTITGPDGEQVEYMAGSYQTLGAPETIKPGETKILFDRFDIAEQYDIKQPGKYHVQFNGDGLEVGVKTDDKAAERYEPESFKHYPVYTGKLPSNTVEIEVKLGET
jgi:hypothetical protein